MNNLEVRLPNPHQKCGFLRLLKISGNVDADGADTLVIKLMVLFEG